MAFSEVTTTATVTGVLDEVMLSYIQLPTFAYTRLLNKPCENEVTLTEQKLPLKCCKHLEIQNTVRKRVDL